MTSKTRSLANLIQNTGDVKAIHLDNVPASSPGVQVYATKENLPATGLTSGDQAYVTNTSRLYISNGSGWYNVALINATPSLTIDPTGAIALSTEGAATVITLTGTDSDNAVDGLTFSVDSDGSFGGLATLSQDSSVFTITPLSVDSATTISSTLTFKASDGISFGAGQRTLSLSFTIQNSNYTTLLLQADASATDNQVDASTSTHTITETGDVTSTAFTPYHPGGYSTYLDGTGDWLTVANGSEQMVPEAGDFTVEFWFYTPNASTRMDPYSSYTSSTGFGIILNYDAGGKVTTYNGNTLTNNSSSGQFSANVWNHLAVSRSGTTTKIFINGTAIFTNASDSTDYSGTATLYIGQAGNNSLPYTGYLKDVRFVKGTAVYTSNFSPPTQSLTAITNTQLLTCHLPYIADGSSNAVTITKAGNIHTQRFAPYDYLGYVKADHGGSVYFDGSGDNITISNFAMADDVTFEFWFYQDVAQSNSYRCMLASSTYGSGAPFTLYTYGTGIQLWLANSGGPHISTTSWAAFTWHHIAMVRYSGTWTLYVDGGAKGTSTTSGTYNFAGTTDWRFGENLAGSYDWKGYIADARFVNGTAVYTSTFTPPTAPLTAISNTSLLTCTNKNDIWDQGSGLRIKPVGTAAASNTQRKFTSSSAMYMDGNSDYFEIVSSDPMVDLINFGTEDFTIETFVYSIATNNNYPSFISSTTGWSSGASGHRFDNLGSSKFWFGLNGASGRSNGDPFMHSTNNFSHDTWYHYAVTRSGDTFKMFINGALEDTQTYTGAYNMALGGCRLGWATWDGGNGYFYGYIQDLRVTKGLARYTSTFTPPTSEFGG